MPRQTKTFKEGDVVAYEGKPAYITDIDDSTGQQHLRLTLIDADGKLTGPSKETWCRDDVQLIDFAETEITIHLPEQWQNTLVPVRKKQDFNTEPVPHIDDEAPDYHPSYGLCSVTRVSGFSKLFMSAMKHHHFIELRVRRATRRRGLSEDRASGAYGKGTDIVDLRFSEAQWGRLLSSIGMGDGVPCTLSYVGGQQMPEVPDYDENEKFHAEIESRAQKGAGLIRKTIARVQELMDKPSVTKAERKELLEMLEHLDREYSANLPFVVKQYDERMEKIVVDAKSEVEGFLLDTAQRLGIEKLLDASKAPQFLLGAPKAKPGFGDCHRPHCRAVSHKVSDDYCSDCRAAIQDICHTCGKPTFGKVCAKCKGERP